MNTLPNPHSASSANSIEDEAAVRALYRQMMDGWNKGSGEAFAAPFGQDGDFIAFDGTLQGTPRDRSIAPATL